ncbi:Rho GTPase activation protein [Fomitopsis serialis]|uniref:Rho GTPase activation protein n=1 Tax=Fomitopsis serialis TaxID=139415 RepID=UPI0020086C1C|nr:Rho GTPase activation protein [Neoantrodia serialis]KAH9937707.1 Rho GTPase activation protein [Neoantrodia serialis]
MPLRKGLCGVAQDNTVCRFPLQPTVLYKRSQDKLDKSSESSRRSTDSASRRVKEKTSWLSLGRHSPTEQWKPATCVLMQEDEACILHVYLEVRIQRLVVDIAPTSVRYQETMLYQSIYVYSLNHTDIRPIHHSLFDRKDCLGIYCVPGQMWCAVPSSDPVFLHFPDEDTLNLWLALLRSYAVPETYGRWLSPSDGGLYRMWRQVELTCLQGRNLGTARPLPDTARGEPDALDMDVYCEVFVDGCLCGRTTVKRGLGAPDWLERFVLADLPQFENLEVVVLREKRMSKPVVLGVVSVALMNFRRGEHIDGWFPVLSPVPGTCAQTGELRLKIRVDEEIILPFAEYSGLLQTFKSRNSLDWLVDLESRLKLKNTIPHHIIAIAIAKDRLVHDIMEMADREVDGTLSCKSLYSPHNTLFRGNTVLTKTVELFMARYGGAFLEASVGTPVRRVCMDKVTIEVDPVRSGKGARSTEKSVEALVYWCQEFWNAIYEARHACPVEMRRLFEHIRRLVERRYGLRDEQNRDLPSQSVSAFASCGSWSLPSCTPTCSDSGQVSGFVYGQSNSFSQYVLVKVIQNLANLNSSVQKEDFMRGVKDFLSSSIPQMVDYIVVVSTPEPQSPSPTSPPPNDKNDRLRIMHTLRQRGLAAPVLYREATPLLPHVLDLPRHLAVVSALVVRYARARNYTPATPIHSGTGDHFDEFCARCLQVEERALFRVSQLASKPRRQPSQPSISSPLAASVPLPPSPTSPMKIPGRRERRISLPKSPKLPKKFARPSTAPGTADSSPRTEPESMPMSPTSDPEPMLSQSAPNVVESIPSPDRMRSLRRPIAPFVKHPRSSSTDSALDRKGSGNG